MKVAIVMGTRPEIIKLSAIINKLKKDQTQTILTGQHYDYDLSLRFIHELGLRKPDFSMTLVNSNPATQMGEMIVKLSKILLKIKPDTVIVQGDTNTVLAASMASLKNKIPVSHVEAGLRSFDWRMPEDIIEYKWIIYLNYCLLPRNMRKKTSCLKKYTEKFL